MNSRLGNFRTKRSLTIIKMRIRLGRTLRLVIALAFLILMIPFLLFKLESSTNEPISENAKLDLREVRVEIFFFIHFFYLYLG